MPFSLRELWSTLTTQLEKQSVTNERLTQKYSCTEKERWEGFLLALAFPGTSEGSKFASVLLEMPCTDIAPQSSLRDALCLMCSFITLFIYLFITYLFITLSVTHCMGLRDNRDQIPSSGSSKVGKQVQKGGIFRCVQQ